MIFTPVGLYYCYKKYNHGKVFSGIYVVLSVYFSSVMVRLLLVMAPAACIASGMGLSWIFKKFTKSIRTTILQEKKSKSHISFEISIAVFLLINFTKLSNKFLY